MIEYKLFTPKMVGDIDVRNRIVMSPMTRGRVNYNRRYITIAQWAGLCPYSRNL